MFLNLLTQSGDSNNPPAANPIPGLLMWGGVIVAIVVFWILNSRSNKKKEAEAKAMLAAVKPGNKVKTIGGICGIVVELCPEDNTFVMETGSEASGKTYLKLDMYAIHQTDATIESN